MAKFSGKLTSPYFLEQGIEKRLWQGKITSIELLTKSLIIIQSLGGIKLFDFATKKTLWEIDCPMHGAIFSPDEKFLVTYIYFAIYIWDLQEGKFLTELKTYARYITSNIIFLPDGETVAFAEAETGLIFYNLSSQQYTHKLEETRDITYLNLIDEKTMMVVLIEEETQDKIISILDLESTIEVKSTKIVNEYFNRYELFSRAISPDNKCMVYAHGGTQKIYLYELDSGKNVQVLADYTDNLRNITSGDHSQKISITFSKNGTLFAVGNSDGNIQIWDFKNGEYLQRITVAENQDIFAISSMSFSPDNKYLAAVDSNNKIQVWELDSDQTIYEKQYSKEFRGVALSMETQLFATCKNDEINLYDFNSGEHVKKIEGSEEYFFRVYFNSKRTKLITLSFGGTIKLWDMETGAELFSLPQEMYYSVAVHPHQEIIAATVKKSNKVEIWNLTSRSLIRTIETSKYHNDSCDLTFSHDGKILLVEDYNYYKNGNNTISFWDVDSGNFLHQLTGISANRFIFSPDGNFIAGESHHYDAVALFDVNSGEKIREFREHLPNAHWSEITAHTFSSDGKLLASGAYDHTVRVWDVATGKQLKMMENHTQTIPEVFFVDNDKTLISTSMDGYIRFWKI